MPTRTEQEPRPDEATAIAERARRARAALVRRAAERQQKEQERAAALRALVPAMAAILRRHGARRVVLFGSLAGGIVHAESDIDLAVEGLDAARLLDAFSAVEELAPGEVDLVRIEDAPAPLRALIARYGEPVDGA